MRVCAAGLLSPEPMRHCAREEREKRRAGSGRLRTSISISLDMAGCAGCGYVRWINACEGAAAGLNGSPLALACSAPFAQIRIDHSAQRERAAFARVAYPARTRYVPYLHGDGDASPRRARRPRGAPRLPRRRHGCRDIVEAGRQINERRLERHLRRRGRPLLACDPDSIDAMEQLDAASRFAHGVCCAENGETCGPSSISLPTTCSESMCARAVSVLSQSCSAMLVSLHFPVGDAFKVLLDAATAACAGVAETPPRRYAITDPASASMSPPPTAWPPAGGTAPPARTPRRCSP